MKYYFDGSSHNNNVKTKSSHRTIFHEVFDWLDALTFSVIVIILIFTFIFRVVGIKGQSMENTLFENDRVIITNFLYSPKQGDVVVISRNYMNSKGDTDENDTPIIKRVIAVAGQEVSINSATGQVKVDGVELTEPYIKPDAITAWPDGITEKTIKVESGKVFVMGDNRENSLDSRFEIIGTVDTHYILGHAVLRIFPFNKLGGL